MSAPLTCPGGCTHTDAEHRAFDRGLRDGEVGKTVDENPFIEPKRWLAWATGHAVGASNREHAKRRPATTEHAARAAAPRRARP